MRTKEEIYQFKVTLKDIDPPVWRSIQVPGAYSFWDLHVAIQDAMGWLDCHLHEFRIRDLGGSEVCIGIPDDDGEFDTLPGWGQRVSEFLSLAGTKFQYTYDFGDDWEHEIELEAVLPAAAGVVYPICIEGERGCPPEDCGGASGYQELLELLAGPGAGEEYENARSWVESMTEGPFDPDAFDPAAVVFSDPSQRFLRAFGGEALSTEDTIWEIIDAFDFYDGRYKRREMEQAVALREEITPYLIRILEELAEDPKKYIAEDHYANTYAVALLSYFEEPAAHLPIIKAFSQPYELLDELWGDMATESLPVFLVQTCNGSLDAIRALVLNKSVHEYVRAAAADALSYAVARGMAQRDEVLSFLAGLFTGEEAERGGDFWSSIACTITDLHPAGAMDVIRKAYADGLIDPDYVGLKEIEDQLAQEPEEVMGELRKEVDRKVPMDLHAYLSWFACFNENENRPAFPPDHQVKSEKKKKKGDKAKKKMAKKSKRKNRK